VKILTGKFSKNNWFFFRLLSVLASMTVNWLPLCQKSDFLPRSKIIFPYSPPFPFPASFKLLLPAFALHILSNSRKKFVVDYVYGLEMKP